MVNYLYDLDKVSGNQERFAATQTIEATTEIRNLSVTAEKTLVQDTMK